MLVKPGGIVAIQVPTFESHRAYMLEQKGKAWTIYKQDKRTTYFSRKFLQNKFESMGLKRVAEAWNSGPEEPENSLFDRYCAVFRKTAA